MPRAFLLEAVRSITWQLLRIIIKQVQCESNHLWRWIHSEPVPIRIRQTGLGVDTMNPVSHLIYTFVCESTHITFASVDSPLKCFHLLMDLNGLASMSVVTLGNTNASWT